MKQISDEIISKINIEIEVSCVDSDLSYDKALYMIDFIRPLFEELRGFIHQYNFQDNNEEIEFFREIKRLLEKRLIKRDKDSINDLITNHQLYVKERRNIRKDK